MSWTVTIEVVGEEQADEIIEVLQNAEEEAEITFGFNTKKMCNERVDADDDGMLQPLNTEGDPATTDTMCNNHHRYNCGVCC